MVQQLAAPLGVQTWLDAACQRARIKDLGGNKPADKLHTTQSKLAGNSEISSLGCFSSDI